MASTQTRPTKQLRELLQEEQEALVVETRLSERAYTQNTSTPELSSGRVSKKPGCVDLQRIKNGFQYSSKLLKSMYNKLVRTNKSSRVKNCNDRGEEEKEEAPSTSLQDRDQSLLVSLPSSTRFDEETKSAAKDQEQEERYQEQEQEQEEQYARGEENSALTACLLGLLGRSTTRNPGRVEVPELQEEAELDDDKEENAPSTSRKRVDDFTSPSSKRFREETEQYEGEEDSVLSASLLGLLVRPTTRIPGRIQVAVEKAEMEEEEGEEAPTLLYRQDHSLPRSPPSSTRSHEEIESTKKDEEEQEEKYKEDSILTASLLGLLVRPMTREPGRVPDLRGLFHCKRMLMQNQQLMLDCVRELIDTFNGRRRRLGGEFLGPEEIGELLLEKMKDWGKRSGDEEDMDTVFRDSLDGRWSDLGVEKGEVVAAIGDEILEELENQFVMGMICGSSYKA